MQAIITRFLPSLKNSDKNGSVPGRAYISEGEIKVSSQAKTIYIWVDTSMSVQDAHDQAALALVKELDWDASCYPSRLIRGGMPDGSGFAYVFGYDAPKTDSILTRELLQY